MTPLFVIATDLAPHDAAWKQATAETDAIADLVAPILGFRPQVVLASLVDDPASPSSRRCETPAVNPGRPRTPGNIPAPIRVLDEALYTTSAPVPARDEALCGTLADILAREATQGGTLAFVLPAILDFSVFQRQALVEIVRESQRRAHSLAVHYDDVDPCHRLVVQAFADALCDRLAGSEV